jgi:hypothetical protein
MNVEGRKMTARLLVTNKDMRLLSQMKNPRIRISSANHICGKLHPISSTSETDDIEITYDPDSYLCTVTMMADQAYTKHHPNEIAYALNPVGKCYIPLDSTTFHGMQTLGHEPMHIANFRIQSTSGKSMEPSPKVMLQREIWNRWNTSMKDQARRDIESAAHFHWNQLTPSKGDLASKFIAEYEDLPACTWVLTTPQEPLPHKILHAMLKFQCMSMHFRLNTFVQLVETQFSPANRWTERIDMGFLTCIRIVMSILRLSANMYQYVSDKGFLKREGFSDIELFKNVRAGLTSGDCEDLDFEIYASYKSILMMMPEGDSLVKCVQDILNLFMVVMAGGVATLPALVKGKPQHERIFHIFGMALPRVMMLESYKPKYEWENSLNCLVLEGTNFHEVDFSHRVPPQQCPLPPNRMEWYRSHMAMLEHYQKDKEGAEIGAEPPTNHHFSCFYREVIFFWTDEIQSDALEYMVVDAQRTDLYGVAFEDVIVGNFGLRTTHKFTQQHVKFYRDLIALREVLPQYKHAEFNVLSGSKESEILAVGEVQMAVPLRSIEPLIVAGAEVFSAELKLDHLPPLHLKTITDTRIMSHASRQNEIDIRQTTRSVVTI